YKRLVYDMQIAQSVSAGQSSQALSSYFLVQATPRPGHTVEELQKVIDEEIAKLQNEPPSEHELDRSLNQIEASFYNRMERVGGERRAVGTASSRSRASTAAGPAAGASPAGHPEAAALERPARLDGRAPRGAGGADQPPRLQRHCGRPCGEVRDCQPRNGDAR